MIIEEHDSIPEEQYQLNESSSKPYTDIPLYRLNTVLKQKQERYENTIDEEFVDILLQNIPKTGKWNVMKKVKYFTLNSKYAIDKPDTFYKKNSYKYQ